jgi:alanine-alpha-ketoisovalerate/valine-pyruvate aminotransferase
MLPSDANSEDDDRDLAVIAEGLYLANLLLIPGIAFAILFWLWLKNRNTASLLARQHLKQTTFVSLYGGLLIVSLSAIFIGVGGLYWEWTWVVVIMYFTCIHSTLVMFGMYALAKAMAGQVWRFPVIGPSIK